MPINRQWLERLMEARGITYYALRMKFHFHPDTINGWEQGRPARPFTVRKLADILGVDVPTIVKGMNLRLMNRQMRRARAPRDLS